MDDNLRSWYLDWDPTHRLAIKGKKSYQRLSKTLINLLKSNKIMGNIRLDWYRCLVYFNSLYLKFLLPITKTCLYNYDPLEPHFYIVKLGFTGVYIIFLISAQKYRLWVSLEPPPRGGSNEYPQSMFWAELWKISKIFWWWDFQYIWIGVFS